MPREKSAGAIVFFMHGAEIEYLLLRYQAGHWDFPKGHIEKGEHELDTVVREVREETGLENIAVTPGFRKHISYFYRKPRAWKEGMLGRHAVRRLDTHETGATFKTVTFYLARSATKRVTLSFEHIGYEWLSYGAALDRLTFDNAKQILKHAHAFLKGRS